MVEDGFTDSLKRVNGKTFINCQKSRLGFTILCGNRILLWYRAHIRVSIAKKRVIAHFPEEYFESTVFSLSFSVTLAH